MKSAADPIPIKMQVAFVNTNTSLSVDLLILVFVGLVSRVLKLQIIYNLIVSYRSKYEFIKDQFS